MFTPTKSNVGQELPVRLFGVAAGVSRSRPGLIYCVRGHLRKVINEQAGAHLQYLLKGKKSANLARNSENVRGLVEVILPHGMLGHGGRMRGPFLEVRGQREPSPIFFRFALMIPRTWPRYWLAASWRDSVR